MSDKIKMTRLMTQAISTVVQGAPTEPVLAALGTVAAKIIAMTPQTATHNRDVFIRAFDRQTERMK